MKVFENTVCGCFTCVDCALAGAQIANSTKRLNKIKIRKCKKASVYPISVDHLAKSSANKFNRTQMLFYFDQLTDKAYLNFYNCPRWHS